MAHTIHSYDNRRNKSNKNKQEKLHLKFEINKYIYVYAYIRKNACTAFKNLICNLSEYKKHGEGTSRINYLSKHHGIVSVKEIEKSDFTLFVYRDPIERILSLYKNKFIVRSKNKDIFYNYQKVTGNNPEESTFCNFVKSYLTKSHSLIDLHCHSQASHLLPIFYTHAIPINKLSSCMQKIIGKHLSNRFFKDKINQTTTLNVDNFAYNISSNALHKNYLKTGFLPSNAALLNNSICEILQQIYFEDFELIDSCEPRFTLTPDKPLQTMLEKNV